VALIGASRATVGHVPFQSPLRMPTEASSIFPLPVPFPDSIPAGNDDLVSGDFQVLIHDSWIC
jgi:hypothetical protein